MNYNYEYADHPNQNNEKTERHVSKSYPSTQANNILPNDLIDENLIE